MEAGSSVFLALLTQRSTALRPLLLQVASWVQLCAVLRRAAIPRTIGRPARPTGMCCWTGARGTGVYYWGIGYTKGSGERGLADAGAVCIPLCPHAAGTPIHLGLRERAICRSLRRCAMHSTAFA